MYGQRPTPRASHGVSRRSALTKAGLFVAGLGLLLTSCTSGSGSNGASSGPAGPTSNPPTSAAAPSQSSSSPTSAAPQPLAFAASPASNSGVSPTTPITLAVTNGTLRTVSLVNSDGKHVAGALSADKRSWHATEVLGYSKSYRLLAQATDTTGEATRTYKRSFTTLTPGNMTMPYLDTIYGSSIENGASYGVAMVPVVSFDEDISRKKVAEHALTVTTSPHVDGSWYWTDDHTVHWRAKHFYQPGTKITIAAKVYGLEVGNGLYGQADHSVSFKIGRKQITIAHDTAPKAVNKVRVYRDNHLVRTMNTSMGEHTGETINGKFINFYTLNGTYTVLGFENPAHMCSDTYGLPANAAGGYPCEDIAYSTKISTDGIYLHELDATVWAQDSGQDVSHGCLNLDYDNAKWYFTHSLVGDPVIIHGAKGAPNLQLWQGGDWSLSWAQWQKGSAFATS